ncbi:MAG: amidohydrolase/deacetylase family metallohydrolase [Bryobacteraceae bacterium]|nr:amidohydrolase/deacetylase family metallohydrolase [Bryobacteraceae bacterium]
MHRLALLLFAGGSLLSAQTYDLLLKGGHVIDPKNNLNAPLDVAITAGKIARVAAGIPASEAKAVADVRGLYVTPGLVDIHVHVYAGTGLARTYTGDLSVYPDPFSFRTGVTTMVDAGTSGWKNFPDFRQRIIDRARTRVLAFLNIVGNGMSPAGESDPANMDAEETAKMARANKDVIVGFKTAHYAGEGWPAVDGATKAGRMENLPVMVDFGTLKPPRNLEILMGDKLRKGDIYTHCYAGLRAEVVDGKVNPAMRQGREKGIYFDVGHGGGSFFWNIAVPAIQGGFYPDSISSDLHVGSMNSGFKDMPNLMSKMLSLGMPLEKVIRASTWNPAVEINRLDLGHLTVGAEADVAVLRLDQGQFGFLDSAGARREGNQRLTAEMTLRRGLPLWDLNGRAAPDWKRFDYKKPRLPSTAR